MFAIVHIADVTRAQFHPKILIQTAILVVIVDFGLCALMQGTGDRLNTVFVAAQLAISVVVTQSPADMPGIVNTGRRFLQRDGGRKG